MFELADAHDANTWFFADSFRDVENACVLAKDGWRLQEKVAPARGTRPNRVGRTPGMLRLCGSSRTDNDI
jgi:hypothetical protein